MHVSQLLLSFFFYLHTFYYQDVLVFLCRLIYHFFLKWFFGFSLMPMEAIPIFRDFVFLTFF